MTGVFDFPWVGVWVAAVAMLIGTSVTGLLEILAVFGLLLALMLLSYLLGDIAKLGRLIFLRKLAKFCERNDVKEFVCVITPLYIAFLNSKGDVVKGIYPRDDFGWTFHQFVENVRVLSDMIGAEIKWFGSLQDLDEGLFQKLKEYEEGVHKEEKMQGGR